MPKFIEVIDGYVSGVMEWPAELGTPSSQSGSIHGVPEETDLQDALYRAYDISTGALGAKRARVVCSRLQFREFFTRAERDALRALVNGPADAISDDPDMIDAVEAFELANYIDTSDPRVLLYLDLLTFKGVIAPGRKAQIAAGEAPPA
jgi:hypothetical protein